MKIAHIDIAADFSPYLGPRYRRFGEYSGEEFHQALLRPAYLANDLVVVHLDGILGFSASFFEESFGGLVREFGLSAVQRKIQFDASSMSYITRLAEKYMADAAASSGMR